MTSPSSTLSPAWTWSMCASNRRACAGVTVPASADAKAADASAGASGVVSTSVAP